MRDFADVGIEVPPGRSGQVRAVCPQCSPSRRPEHRRERDLSVNLDEGSWFCHHCGWSGGLKGGEEAPSRPRTESGRREYKRPEPLAGELTAEALAFFASRRIPAEVVRRNGIVVVREVFFPQLNRRLDALAFPYFRDGELINIKYRAQGVKEFRLVSGCERTLYGLDDIKGAETVVIVEGELDKLAVEAAGIRECVSVPDGAPPPDARSYEAKFAFLSEPVAEQALAAAKRIVIATDADEPGRKLATELARRLGKDRCFRVEWPDGIKDANEALIEAGPHYLAALIEDAEPWPIDGIIRAADVKGELLALYRNELPPGESTGFADLRWTVKEGQLTVITGIPGSGKSEWLDAVLVNLARRAGWRFAVYSPENHPVERHIAKLIEKWSGKPFRRWVPGVDRITEGEVMATLPLINARFSFLAPESPTLDALLELARAQVYRLGVKGLVLDPWNELEHQRSGGMSETEYISQSLSKLRNFARHHGVHVFIVAHPAKLTKENGEYPIPTPYDISGSAHWYNKADNCLTVSRNKANEAAPIEVHVQKVRFREVGELGVCKLYYDRLTGCYLDYDGDDGWVPGSSYRS